MDDVQKAERVVERLQGSLNALLERYNQLSVTAAQDGVSGAEIAEQAHSLADLKSEISVTRSALHLAQKNLSSAQESANEADAIHARERVCELTSDLLRQAKKFEASIKKAGREFHQINETLLECKNLSHIAKDWPDEVFQHQKPYHWAYNHFINLSALHLGLTPSLHFTHWPKADAAQDGADPARAYRSLISAKDLWQNPQPHCDEPAEEITEYREATPEEVENVA